MEQHRPTTPDINAFEIVVASLGGTFDPSLPIAAARTGALGLLDLTYLNCPDRARKAVERLCHLARGRYGVILSGRLGPVERAVLEELDSCDTILLVPEPDADMAPIVDRCRSVAGRLGLIVDSLPQAETAASFGFDLVVAKGFEAGGLVSEETSFILTQRLLRWGRLPLWVWGGIGADTAAACCVGGAAGVVLDWQLALLRESPLATNPCHRLWQLDGYQTALLPAPGGRWFRCLDLRTPDTGARSEGRLAHAEPACLSVDDHEAWHAQIAQQLSAGATSTSFALLPAGQDAAMAASWARRHSTVARALAALQHSIRDIVAHTLDKPAISTNNPLAQSLGIEFPIAQGPMTRVTDSPEFALAVAKAGALPFLSLGLMPAAQVQGLLSRTSDILGQLPWGVAVLSFAERSVREEQLRTLEAMHPPVALLGAGTAEEVKRLEQHGTKTYLYVASPAMLRTFLDRGARRFVFEGCECGGYVGPRTGFVLWQQMVDVLAHSSLPDAERNEIQVLLAGGIHDARSSRMASAVAQRLADRGIQVGALVGTAYLFTHEIVETGAVTAGFQQEALRADQTVRVALREGRAVRCAVTPLSQQLVRHEQQRPESIDGGKTRTPRDQAADEAASDLPIEQVFLDRLRTASRGVARRQHPDQSESPFVTVDDRQQRRDGLYVMGQAASLQDERCTVRELHERLCPSDPRPSVQTALPQIVVDQKPEPPAPLDIAIVGMACLLPGADEIGQYWENILDQRDVIEEIPRDRFHIERWYDPDRSARDKVNSRWGGFLHDLPFDPLRYGIPPMTIKSIEPMQLLALLLVDQVLQDAGYADDRRYHERTSVIFGAGGGSAELGANYAFRAMLPQYVENPDESLWRQLPEWTEDSFAGILLNVVSGRISNRFDFGGTNFTVDAACASSLAAVYLACRELVDGSADMVITGGCDTVQNPISYLCFGKSGALSPTGRSRPFDQSADGITISEGLAAVVLKRREDAERDGDRIYAVIRALAGGSDGRSKGLTAPRPEGQLRTFQRAYAQARFSPTTVELFEAHGTGTALGDATECGSLTRLLTEAGAAPRSHAVGSVKSMMGHTKCTAGVAGLIKAALALHHATLPPTMHVKQPNEKAGLVDGPLYPNTEARPWIRGAHPRRAGVSAFGFGGTNFHAVLEEYADDPLPRTTRALRRTRTVEPFFFSAATPEVLATRIEALAQPLRQALAQGTNVDLANLAFTWYQRSARTDAAAVRAAVVARDAHDLAEKLDRLQKCVNDANGSPAEMPEGVIYTASPQGKDTPLAVLFPGQGSQYVNMLRELALEFGEVAETLESADAALRNALDHPLSRYIFPPPAFDDDTRRRAAEELKSTDILQPALGAMSLGLWRLFEAFGVRPGMLAGHSYGELVALCVAGCLPAETLYHLSWARGKAIVDMTESGGDGDLGQMIAVRASEEEVEAALAECREVWLANLNSPRQTIVSGTREGISRAVAVLHEKRLAHTPLAVSCGFHSPLMKPASRRFQEVLAKTTLQSPRLPVYSNRTGKVYPDDPREIRHELTEHLVDRVRFTAEIEAMYEAGARVFVEVGPGRVLSKLVDDILGSRPHVAIATSVRQRHDVHQFAEALAQLFVHGVDIELSRWFARPKLAALDLATMKKADEKPLPRHVWLVNGGYARPLGQPPRDPTPQARLATEQHSTTSAPQAVVERAASASAGNASAAGGTSGPMLQAADAGGPKGTATTPDATAASTSAGTPESRLAATNTNALRDSTSQRNAGHRGDTTTAGSAPGGSTGRVVVGGAAAGHSASTGGGSTAAPRPADSTVSAHTATNTAVSNTTNSVSGFATTSTSTSSVSRSSSVSSTSSSTSDTSSSRSSQVTSSKPRKDVSPVVEPRPVTAPFDPEGIENTRLPMSASEKNPRAPSPTSQSGSTGRSAIDAEAFALFQETMRRFLDVQETAVAAFFGGTTLPTVPAASAGQVIPHEEQPAAALDSPAAPVDVSPAVAPPTVREPAATAGQPPSSAAPSAGPVVAPATGEPLPNTAAAPETVGPLGGAGTSTVGADDTPAPPAEQAATPPVAEPVPAAASPETASQPAEAGGSLAIDADTLAAQLVDIVSQRTGYPPEMLDLDANLEADLGIDSIKRVEIIGVFRRQALPEMDEPPEWFMEKMGAAGTLREVLEGVMQLLGDASASGDVAQASASATASANATGEAGEPPSPEVEIAAENVAATSVQPEQLHQSLVDIVSQRTGYPPEMLDLDANLEADLGIDSIKRVEVIGAFRRIALPGCEEPPEWFMEEMSSAGTLRAILEGVQKLASENGHASGGHHSGNGQAEHATHVPVAEGRPVNPKIAPNRQSAPADSAPYSPNPNTCPRCVVRAIACPIDADRTAPLPEGTFLLTDDGRGLAQHVVSHFKSLRRNAVVISADLLADEAATAEAIQRIRSEQGPIAGLLHLLPAREAQSLSGIDREAFSFHWNQEVRGLLFLLKALAPELRGSQHDRFWIAAVSFGGSHYGTHSDIEASRPWRGGLSGLMKAAAKEWPGARFRLIDVDTLPSVDQLLNECGQPGSNDLIEVGYRDGNRLMLRAIRCEIAAPSATSANAEAAGTTSATSASCSEDDFALSADDVVLVTGGARGITAEIVHEIGGRTGATFILLGRTAAPNPSEDPRTANVDDPRELSRLVAEQAKASGQALTPKSLRQKVKQLIAQHEIRRTLERLAAAGVTAEYLPCDIRDHARLAALIDDVGKRRGPVTAIIHGAGVIEDHYITDKTAESFDRVVGTKLDPLLNLLDRVDAKRLRLLMLFSSVAGFFGNAGQADYAAANETLNRIAWRLGQLLAPRTRVVAINWGPWQGLGMVTPEVARQFAERGVGMIRPEDGRVAALCELHPITAGDHVVIYGPGPWLDEANRLAEETADLSATNGATHADCAATGPGVSSASDSGHNCVAPPDLPLLGGLALQPDGEAAWRVDLVLDPEQHLFLRHHCIDGKPVLPAAVALELIAEAAAAVSGNAHVHQIEDLRLFKGVVVDNGRHAIQLHVKRLGHNEASGTEKWQVRLHDGEPPHRPLYGATVFTSRVAPQPPQAPQLPRIEEPSPISAKRAYDEWLFHGPMFHTIQELRGVDATGMDAWVRSQAVVPTPRSEASGSAAVDEPQNGRPASWLIDPAVVDAAPQMALLWSRATYGTSMLPNRIGLYRRYGSLSTDRLELLLRVDPETDPNTLRGDAWFLQNGQVVGFIGGLECAGSAALNRIGGSHLR